MPAPNSATAAQQPASPDSEGDRGQGPLKGIRVVEFSTIGPAPFACMLLADLGAEVLRVVRPGDPAGEGVKASDVYYRGRPTIALDLRDREDRTRLLDLIVHADALIEGFRPGVMERLGLSPEVCHELHPGLIYGRVDRAISRAAGGGSRRCRLRAGIGIRANESRRIGHLVQRPAEPF